MDENTRCVFYVEKWENVVSTMTATTMTTPTSSNILHATNVYCLSTFYSLLLAFFLTIFLFHSWTFWTKIWCIFLIYTAVININHNLSRFNIFFYYFLVFARTSELCKYFYAVFMLPFRSHSPSPFVCLSFMCCVVSIGIWEGNIELGYALIYVKGSFCFKNYHFVIEKFAKVIYIPCWILTILYKY